MEQSAHDQPGAVVSQDGKDGGQDEPSDPISSNKALKKRVESRAVGQRLHKNLGHPSSSVLHRMLNEVQATPECPGRYQGLHLPHMLCQKAPISDTSGISPEVR